MESIESMKKQLHEVNRDIEGMLLAGAKSEKEQKVLSDAREYRAGLEDDLLRAVNKEGKTEEPAIIGIIVIGI